MVTYITRRLLLIVPTMLLITFMVFMIIALSPGGIGAALKASQPGGGVESQTNQAVREAYLDDRYGLDDPAPVQFMRWLARVSPIKFGTRDQIAPNGDRFEAPRKIKGPAVWGWFVDQLPQSRPAVLPEPDTRDGVIDLFRKKQLAYASARRDAVAANALLKDALGRYAQDIGVRGALTSENKVIVNKIASHKPGTSDPHWPELKDLGNKAIAAYGHANEAREQLLAAFNFHPYQEAGFPIIPGVLSVGAPDFGVSFTMGRPVLDLVMGALPVTVLINALATPIIYAVAIPTGILAAVRRGQKIDTVMGTLFIMLYSFPIVLAGTLAIGYLANRQYLGWFPVSGLHGSDADSMRFMPGLNRGGAFEWGYIGDTLWHLTLPVLCNVYTGFAILSKQTRAAMLDNLNADYVRTAKAKGVPAKDVVMRHVFRNSLIPQITMFVSILPGMLAGSLIIEKIFTIQGMGLLMLQAINLRDREVILADTLMVSLVSLIALLLADILYAMADPRVAYD